MRVLPRVTGYAVLTGMVLISTGVLAADSGDSIFAIDLKDDQGRGEGIYEHIERDVKETSGPGYTQKIKGDTLYLRFHNPIGKTASFDVDLGGINPDGGDLSWYVGGGVRYLPYDGEVLRVSTFAQIHYSPLDLSDGGVDSDFDYFQGEAGVLFNAKINVQDQFMVMPYAGPLVSLVRLDGDVKWSVTDANGNPVTTKEDFDAEEDNLLGMAFGVTVKLRENHTMRLETQYFENWNVSAAAGVAF